MANIIKRIDDYVDQLHEKYPEMSKKDILKILKKGFNFYRPEHKKLELKIN